VVFDEIGAADGSRAFAPAVERGRRATSFLIADRAQGAVVVYNNPVNFVDPFGLDFIDWVFTGNWNATPAEQAAAASGWELGAGEAAQAELDALNPFGDPFASGGGYDPCDSYNQFAGYAGNVAAISYGAAGLANLYSVPANVYHFTTAAGGAGINATGGIAASSFGVGGAGTYFTASTSATIATLQGAQGTAAVVQVSTAGLSLSPTIIPGTFVLRNASLLLR